MTSTITNSEHAHRDLIELVQDHGDAAYDDIRHQYPTADPTKVAALVEEISIILAEALEIEDTSPGDRYMSSVELAREHRWKAEDMAADFLRTVAS